MKAVVMSGGGAGGCIQVGMLSALAEQGTEFTHAYGVSTGALNAAGLAYQGLEGLRANWFALEKNSDIFKPNWLGGPFYGDSLYKSDPLRKRLESTIQGEPRIHATVAAVDLHTGLIHYDTAGSETFLESTLASASVPLHAPPVKNLVDGGVRDITPIKKAITDGHTDITVLLAQPWTPDSPGAWPMPKSKWFRGLKVAARAVDILASEIFKNDIKLCLLKNRLPEYSQIKLTVYAPATRTIATNEFNQPKIQENYAYGYAAVHSGPIVDSGE